MDLPKEADGTKMEAIMGTAIRCSGASAGADAVKVKNLAANRGNQMLAYREGRYLYLETLKNYPVYGWDG